MLRKHRLRSAARDLGILCAVSELQVATNGEPWDDLIAVWQWSKVSGLVSATPSSLIFTGQDIRIAEPRLRLAIGYERLGEYAFGYEYTPGGRTGPDRFELVIDGPTPWRSPRADQEAELIAVDLTQIKALAAAAPDGSAG